LMMLFIVMSTSLLLMDGCDAAGLDAYTWSVGSGGEVLYALGCDFYGNDIGSVNSADSDCGDICFKNANCDHFSFSGGVCYLKAAVDPAPRALTGGVCGLVIGRPATGKIAYLIVY